MLRVVVLKPVLFAILAVLGACGRDAEPAFVQRHGHPLIFAHRGGAGLAPESTLPTFLAQHARDPASVVEMDVHATRDGALVVIHDDTVDRTTNGTGPVAALTLAEVRALDAAYCFSPGTERGTPDPATCRTAPADMFPLRGAGYRVPTLIEVLDALPADAIVGVEIKAPHIEDVVVSTVRATRALDRVIIGSEHDESGIRAAALLPEAAHYMPAGAAKCLALTSKIVAPYAGCPHYDVFASPLTSAGLALDTREMIDRVHDRGVAIVYWTINDEAEIERLFRLGADGVFTDYPDRGRRVADRLRAEGFWR